jgi:hypothetical protein
MVAAVMVAAVIVAAVMVAVVMVAAVMVAAVMVMVAAVMVAAVMVAAVMVMVAAVMVAAVMVMVAAVIVRSPDRVSTAGIRTLQIRWSWEKRDVRTWWRRTARLDRGRRAPRSSRDAREVVGASAHVIRTQRA